MYNITFSMCLTLNRVCENC